LGKRAQKIPFNTGPQANFCRLKKNRGKPVQGGEGTGGGSVWAKGGPVI